MDATNVGTNARAGLKHAFSNKPKMSYAKASEVAASARRAFKEKK
jgi:hypothetical protein